MLQHKGTVTLETHRLILRRFTLEDAEDMFSNWANDSEVTKYLTWWPHDSIDTTREVLSIWINEYSNNTAYNWAIELKETGQIIGSISVVDLCSKDCRCEIGYCISKVYWNKGITTEALKEVIGFLFSQVGINRIQAKHDVLNIGSGKVMQKAGMKYEGTFRQFYVRKDGSFGDVNMYAALQEDYTLDKLERK
ncbi:MAG: GNAT family N-acetyltransferase [Caldicoprobacterales bacterium]|jgi:ribosomal-protein-alanine N-acetyltransferase|nr:GNAT family N-acetyltransferase [Clostridiales bacterium]